MRSSPSVIFDFDGTIADSLELVVSAFNQVAPFLRVRPVERAALPRMRMLEPQTALREHGVSFWKLPFLVHGVRIGMRRGVTSLEPFAGMAETLRALRASGCRCYVLSTNSSDNIARFLARHDLNVFEQIAGGASMFGKARALTRLLRSERVDPRAAYYVGDEVRDIVAARKARMRSVAVNWGYGAPELLAAAAPDHMIEQPAALLALLGLAP